MHPLLRSMRGDIRATAVRLLAYVGGLAVLSIIAASLIEQKVVPIPRMAENAFKPDWIVVERPYPAFALSMPELPEADFSYAIQRHTTGNGRKDILNWGDSDTGVARTHVEIYRPGSEQERFGDAATEFAARLPAGTMLTASEMVETKFGPTMFVMITLRGSNPLRQCLGFARAFDDPRIQMSGWWCGDNGEAIDRPLLACAVDRLMLLSAASEPKVGTLFANAELKRDFCGRKPTPVATTIKRRPATKKDEPKRALAAER